MRVPRIEAARGAVLRAVTMAVFDPQFIKSAQEPGQFPADRGSEVAFAGRSNSGKSSAINAVLGHGKLARTSKTPGRTQLVNFFSVGPERRVVDLPGYGYARVPPAVQPPLLAENWVKAGLPSCSTSRSRMRMPMRRHRNSKSVMVLWCTFGVSYHW
jgi:hypothetical protein